MSILLDNYSLKKILEKNKFVSSLAIYFFGTILIKGISLITTPIFTRVLSTNDYGIISIFQTWVGIFAVFIGLQMSGSIATARVHLPINRFVAYLRSILGLSFISFLFIAILSLVFNQTLSDLFQLQSNLIPYLLIQAFGTSCAVFFLSYSIQTKQPKIHLFFSVTSTIFVILLSLILVLSFHENKYMGRIIGGTVVNIFIIGFVYRKLFFSSTTKIEITDWKYALPLSLPLIVHLISNLIIGQSDRLMISKFLGYESAAVYSVAYTIGSLGLMIAEATNNIWSPWYLDNTKVSQNDKISKLSEYYIEIISYVFIAIMLISPEILKLMAPKEYFTGIGSLVIVTAGVFFQFLYRFPLAYEQYSRNMKWVAISTIISALINLILNYFFIPHWGIIGAAYATLIAYIVLFIMHEFVARKIIKGYNINFSNYLLGIFFVSTFAIVSFILVDFWYFRYPLLIIISTFFLYRALKLKKQIPLIT